MINLYKKNWDFITNAHKNGNLAHAFLFCGPSDLGKFDFAIEVAKEIGGFNKDANNLAKGEDPDLFVVEPQVEEKKGASRTKDINAEQLKIILEKASFFPYQAKQKFLVIKSADRMTNVAANSILKLIEEPSADLGIILTAENEDAVLSTIKSRCQVLRFGLADDDQVKEYLREIHGKGKLFSEKNISRAIGLSGGKAKLARQILESKELADQLEKNIENFRGALRGGIYSGLKFSEKESADKKQLFLSIDGWIAYLGGFLKKMIKDKADKKIQKKVLFMLKELVQLRKQIKHTNASERLMLDNFFVKINW